MELPKKQLHASVSFAVSAKYLSTLHAPSRVLSREPFSATRASAVKRSFEEAYRKAFTMSELYAKHRPDPIPRSEHQLKWKQRDVQEIIEAGKTCGKGADNIRSGLERLDALLPEVVNLDKMRASDWVTVISDVNAVAEKLILLKTFYPKADLSKLIANRPKMLLQSTVEIRNNAVQVHQMLASSKDVDAIVEAVPELADSQALASALSYLSSWFRGNDPVEVLDRDPTFLLRTGQSEIDPDEEYGIIAFF